MQNNVYVLLEQAQNTFDQITLAMCIFGVHEIHPSGMDTFVIWPSEPDLLKKQLKPSLTRGIFQRRQGQRKHERRSKCNMSTAIDPNYELPPEDTVVVECETLEVTGEITSPTITNLNQSITNHINDNSKHRQTKIIQIVTDGTSTSYTIMHALNSVDLQITFYDVTTIPQQLFFVQWEPMSNDAIRIVPDVVLPANRKIKIIIQS